MVSEKVVEKIQKLKAHAESAQRIGSEAEAEAFASMIQQLLLKYKLSMTDVDLAEERVSDPIGAREVDWQDVRVRRARVAWMERLADVVARAYFCRMLVHRGSSALTLVGRKSDVDLAEFMLVTLTRAAERIAEREYVAAFRQDVAGARGFKASFLRAFVERLQERFEDEVRGAEAASDCAIVRFEGARKEVDDFIASSVKTRRVAVVRGARGDANAEGWRRGRKVADGVNLRPNVVGAGSPAPAARRLS